MTIFIGDSLTWLKKLPSESVHCIVTSPPYYGKRDYGVNGQIGLEETPELFIEKMVAIFAEARRVLRHDGTCWINLGDSYASAKGRRSSVAQTLSGKLRDEPVDNNRIDLKEHGYKDKDLLFIPHRVAMALQNDGWWVRNDIVWHKPNPMPESVRDRCTVSKEYVFLCAKSERYYFDADAIREPHSVEKSEYNSGQKFGYARKTNPTDSRTSEATNGAVNPLGRNKRDVWTINTEASGVAHFATMPLELAETCIKAGCPETVCAVCGAGYVAVVESHSVVKGERGTQPSQSRANLKPPQQSGVSSIRTVHGYEPSCTCNGATAYGVVLDPFGGAGTTALAAIKHNRHYQLIELNPKYVGIAQQRIAAFNPMQDTPLADGSKQLSLFKDTA